jgi:hypothetical protein
MFGFGKKKEKVEYIDEKILEKIKEIKEYIERRPQAYKRMNHALISCQIMFSNGLRKGQIKNKATINASLQLTQKLIDEAKEKAKEDKKKSKEKK